MLKTNQPSENQKIAKLLLESELVSPEDLKRAEHLSALQKKGIMEVLLEIGALTNEQMGQFMAMYYSVPYANLRQINVDESLMKQLPEEFADAQQVVLFKKDETSSYVAAVHPNNPNLRALLEKKFGNKLRWFYSNPNDLKQALHLYHGDEQSSLKEIELQLLDTDEDVPSQMLEFVDGVFEMAYNYKASDLHVEPQELETVLRLRIDGVLEDVYRMDKRLHEQFVTRIKIMSQLRTDEHMSAQDGRLQFVYAKEKVDMRVSILPTTFGEKVVLRLLSEKSRQFSLEELGMDERHLALIKAQASKPWGMILVTGPTGSGKTTTLYGVLKTLNRREVNLSTIEDPVEYSLSGVNQIQVHPETGLNFADGLRSIVRQDPDIIMVGEIRDTETADISVNAALTGHLLLSTLHTNDAATALPRLLEMGVEPFLVASTVNVIVAQRLLRSICQHCIHSTEIDLLEIEEEYVVPERIKSDLFVDGKAELYEGAGCEVCHHTGYHGRIGVFEMLEVDGEVRKLIVAQASSDEIKAKAVEKGMITMFDDAIEKVNQGKTSLTELLRVVRE